MIPSRLQIFGQHVHGQEGPQSPRENLRQMLPYHMLPKVFLQEVLRHSSYDQEQTNRQDQYCHPEPIPLFGSDLATGDTENEDDQYRYQNAPDCRQLPPLVQDLSVS